MDVDGNGWSLLSFGCDLEVLALLGVACVWNRQLLSQIYVMDHRCHCHFIEFFSSKNYLLYRACGLDRCLMMHFFWPEKIRLICDYRCQGPQGAIVSKRN